MKINKRLVILNYEYFGFTIQNLYRFKLTLDTKKDYTSSELINLARKFLDKRGL